MTGNFGYETVIQLHKNGQLPQALFCLNDICAIGGIEGLQGSGPVCTLKPCSTRCWCHADCIGAPKSANDPASDLCNTGVFTSKKPPIGKYFFVVSASDGTTVKTKNVTLIRDFVSNVRKVANNLSKSKSKPNLDYSRGWVFLIAMNRRERVNINVLTILGFMGIIYNDNSNHYYLISFCSC